MESDLYSPTMLASKMLTKVFCLTKESYWIYLYHRHSVETKLFSSSYALENN